jgi:hypothetical protein
MTNPENQDIIIAQIKTIIKECSTNPNLSLIIDGNGSLATTSRVNKNAANLVQQFINDNKDSISKALQESYMNDGIDCSKFQNSVNKVYKNTKAQPINFLQAVTSNWMKNMNDELKAKPLTDIILPGTHDSGSSIHDIHLEVMPAFAKTWKEKLLNFIVQIPIVSNIVKNWTVTQDQNIEQQLQNGVRMFDFRLAKDSNGTLRLGHTFLLNTLEDYCKKIATFTDAHKGEVLMINIKPDSPYSGVLSDEDKKKAYEIISNTLGEKILPNTKEIGTINQLTENGTQSKIILYTSGMDVNDCTIARIGNKSKELWPNKVHTKDALSELERQREDFANNKGHDGTEFTYASLNTTPDAKSIVKKVLFSDLIKSGKKIQQKGLTDFLNHDILPAAVMMDSPNANSIQQIVLRNVKGKEEFAKHMSQTQDLQLSQQPTVVDRIISGVKRIIHRSPSKDKQNTIDSNVTTHIPNKQNVIKTLVTEKSPSFVEQLNTERKSITTKVPNGPVAR